MTPYIPFGQQFEETNRVLRDLQILEGLLTAAEERVVYLRDEKTYTSLENIFLLLRNGAESLGLNRDQVGGDYLHEVLWEDQYLFITTTKREVDFDEALLQDRYVQ